jgi:hypothetical protein
MRQVSLYTTNAHYIACVAADGTIPHHDNGRSCDAAINRMNVCRTWLGELYDDVPYPPMPQVAIPSDYSVEMMGADADCGLDAAHTCTPAVMACESIRKDWCRLLRLACKTQQYTELFV